MALPADKDRCFVVLAFNIGSGNIDGVDVSGLNVIVVADSPAQMTDGHWRVGLVVDAAASQKQGEALGAVFGGQKGGPMGALAPLIGELLGIQKAKIEYFSGGIQHRVKAGDLIEMEVEDFLAPGMNTPTLLVGVGHPVSSTLTVARAKSSRFKCFGYDRSNTGMNGHAAPFSWSAEA
jgi:hypothetical protein